MVPVGYPPSPPTDSHRKKMAFTFTSRELRSLETEVCSLDSLIRQRTIRGMAGSALNCQELRCAVPTALDGLALLSSFPPTSPSKPKKSSLSSPSQTTERRRKFSGSSMEMKVVFKIARMKRTDLEMEMKFFLVFRSLKKVCK